MSHKTPLSFVSLAMIFTIFVAVRHHTQTAHAATINVTTTNTTILFDGDCSLPEALINANDDARTHADCPAGSGPDTIVLQRGATYTFNPMGDALYGGPVGVAPAYALPTITTEITIIGNGATIERDPSGTLFGLFGTRSGATLVLDDMTIRGGRSSAGGAVNVARGTVTIRDSRLIENTAYWGGAIDNSSGDIAIINSTITGNSSWGAHGGAIHTNSGSINIIDSVFRDNVSAGKGGAIDSVATDFIIIGTNFSNNVSERGDGGAISVSGNRATMTIDASLFDNNRVLNPSFRDPQSRGGAIIFGATNLDITGTDFTNNSADVGGGLYLSGFSTPTEVNITGGSISNNFATDDGGGVFIRGETSVIMNGVTLNGNDATNGGAIFNQTDEAIRINTSTIQDNIVLRDGGGIHNSGILTITDSTLRGNRAVNGGGIFNIGRTVIFESLLWSNRASGAGGGVHHSGGDILRFWNSTLTANRADEQGGALVNLADSDLSFVTITNNQAPRGGGIAQAGGTLRIDILRIRSSIVANNPGGDCFGRSGFTAIGINLDSDSSCDGFTMPGRNPRLAALDNNGGPTRTHALRNDSPALDAADACFDAFGFSSIFEDQRGIARPQGIGCDLGAFEREVAMTRTSGELPASEPCVINNDAVGTIPVQLGPGVNRAVAGFLPAVQNLEVIGQNETSDDESDDTPLYYLLPNDLFGQNTSFNQLWVLSDLVNLFGDCTSLAIVMPDAPQRQTTVIVGADCGNFAVTAPRDGFPQGPVTFFWNPAPNATDYQMTIRNLDSNLQVFSQTVAAPTTSLTTDVSTAVLGNGFTFEYDVVALRNGQAICSETVRILRESLPPDQPPSEEEEKSKPMCGNGIQEPGETDNTCPNGF